MKIVLFLVVSILAANAAAQTNEPSDVQVWNDTSLTIPLVKSADKKSDRIALVLTGTLRAGRNMGRLVDERAAVGVEFHVNDYVTITPSYLYRAEQPVRGASLFESRYRIDVQLEKKFSRFTIKDRNRIEHRSRNSRSDITRYRNRFQVLVPIKKNDKELFTPFVGIEPFYEFQSRHWTRNETSVGIAKKVNSQFSFELYYLLQNNRGPNLKFVNVIGTSLKFRID